MFSLAVFKVAALHLVLKAAASRIKQGFLLFSHYGLTTYQQQENAYCTFLPEPLSHLTLSQTVR